MAEKTSGSSGSGTATQDKQDKQDRKEEKAHGIERDNDGNVQPLEYPEQKVQDKITYRDPRPLDWPQKADRSVFIGVVQKASEDADPNDGDYVDATAIRGDEELEVGGTPVEHAQVIAGGGQLTLIINGEAFVLGSLGGGIQSDLQKALQLNANS